MDQSSKSRRPGPPHNPGVRELVDNKRRWSTRAKIDDAKNGFQGWHERGYLPHRDEPGLVQFVTFRLADSFPESLRSEWEHLLKIEDDIQRRSELESYLDKGRGECCLKRSEFAGLAEEVIRFFHGKRYELRAWVIMPNHVHISFEVGTMPMSKIIESWKRTIAFKLNRQMSRSGKFWQADYWDTFMRNGAHEMDTRNYIENNPVKAGLIVDPKNWMFSSARYRDEYGVLKL